MSGKVVLSEQQEAKVLAVAGLIFPEEIVEGIKSFIPPGRDNDLWRFEFINGNVGISDGHVLIVYGNKKEQQEKSKLELVKP